MFKEIYKLIKMGDYYNVSPEIEILKGHFSKVDNAKDVITKYKRVRKWQI